MGIEQHMVRILAVAAVVWGNAGIAGAEVQREAVESRLQRIVQDWTAERPGVLGERRSELLAQWAALPPEQRQQMRQQMREHWQNMPPPAQREYRQDARERWPQMPSEERRRMRDEMREQRGGHGGRDGDRNFRR